MDSDKGRAKTKRANQKKRSTFPLATKAFQTIRRHLRAHINDRSKYAMLGAHFESTFEPWMNWTNYGRYEIGGPRKWCIGHWIPCIQYAETDADMKRCFDFANMRAQDAEENAKQRDDMPPPDVLEGLKSCWPMSWP